MHINPLEFTTFIMKIPFIKLLIKIFQLFARFFKIASCTYISDVEIREGKKNYNDRWGSDGSVQVDVEATTPALHEKCN